MNDTGLIKVIEEAMFCMMWILQSRLPKWGPHPPPTISKNKGRQVATVSQQSLKILRLLIFVDYLTT